MEEKLINTRYFKVLLKDKSTLLAICLGLSILFTAPQSWLYYDIRYYIDWYNVVWSKSFYTIILKLNPSTPSLVLTIPSGLLRVYIEAEKVSYPPLPILLFVATYSIANAATRSIPLIRFIVKLPVILSYFIITYLLGKNYGSKARTLWLINVFSFVTIFTYHTDLIVALAILLAYIAYTRNRFFMTGLYASIAFLFKPFSIVPLLPLVLKIIHQSNIKDFIKLTLGFTLSTVAVIQPFLLVDPSVFINKAILYHSYRYPQEYSLWAIPIYLTNYDFTKIPYLLVWIWSPVLIIALATVAIQFIRARDFSELNVLKYIIIISLLSLLINKVGNLNYFTWFLPLLVIYIVNTKLYSDRKFLTIYLAIPIALGIFAGFFTFYAAFIVGEPIYIIEDQSLYSPYIAEKSFDPASLQATIAEYLRLRALWFFKPLYETYNLTYVMYTLLYVFFLLYLLFKIKGVRSGAGVQGSLRRDDL